MSKFKVGDKVVSSAGAEFTELLRSALGVREYYIITRTSAGGFWLQLDYMQRYGDPTPWRAEDFELYQEPDDELPPAPTSVSYLKDGGQRKLQAQISGDSVHLLLSLRKVSTLGYSLDPDSALQLAHDLRRMAMEIKRKEKAQ